MLRPERSAGCLLPVEGMRRVILVAPKNHDLHGSAPDQHDVALILIDVINVRSFGWTMPLQIPPLVLVQALVLSVGAALLAAVYPVKRLQRLSVAAALRQE